MVADRCTLITCSTHVHAHTYSGADLYAKDNNLCTPAHSAVMHQCVDAYHFLMEHIPDKASVIFSTFEVKNNRSNLLKVCM